MNDSSLIALLIDLVIGFTLVEGVALAVYHRITGKGVALRDFALNMASGLYLMLALRCLAHDAGIAWVALFLVAAGLAHGTDLWLRWRRGVRAATAHRRSLA
ncbi:MAG: hypothetical protein H7Z15_17120 [Rhizobacter sp.]|nr:hypothetical protein [Rhizobacter sp.]